MGVQLEDQNDVELPTVEGLPILPPRALDVSAAVIRDVLADLEASAAAIPEGQDGAIIGSYTRDRWFGAVVVKAPGGFIVKGFVGQEGGQKLDWGVGVLKTFKF